MAYRPTDKTRAHMAAQRHKLLSAAEQLVREQGFGKLTITKLANKSGLAVGSVYKHFKSKDDLLEQVYKDLASNNLTLDSKQILVSDNAKEQLSAALEQFFSQALMADKLSYALFYEAIPPAVETQRQAFKANYARTFSQIIKQGMSQQLFLTQEPELSANAVVGILTESLLIPLNWQHQQMPTFERIKLIQQCQQFCLRAISYNGDETSFFEH
mgnify:CR=1 FL=1